MLGRCSTTELTLSQAHGNMFKFIFIHVSLCAYTSLCADPNVGHKKESDTPRPGTGAVNGCEPPDVDTGERARVNYKRIMSPAPYFNFDALR